MQVSSPKNEDALNKLSLFTLVVFKHNNISLDTLAQDETHLNGVGDRLNREDRKFFISRFAAGKAEKYIFIFCKSIASK